VLRQITSRRRNASQVEAAQPAKPPRISRIARREERSAYIFLSPWLIGVLAFWLIPIVASVVLSFTNYRIIGDAEWVGLRNYRELFFDDRTFWVSVGVTLKYMVMSVPLYLVCGVLLGLLLNLKVRGINLFRTILFLPAVLSGVAVAVLWVALLNPDVGVVNQILESIGLENPPRWLNSPTWAVPAMVLVGLWGIGGGAIIYLAGLQNIPEQLYEVARLDGAGAMQRFRYVTLPMLTPTMLFVLLTGLIDAFQVFDLAYVLSAGGGGGVRESLMFYLINLWNEAFQNGRFGYGSALAWVLVVIAGIVILAIFKTSGRWVYYEYDPESER
jgi:multiple sugar transport system permease protein